ncbi:HofO family protein [Pantoea sp. AS142]|uniref:HofO family protein n=1 Tax=Pantoea sp. AS142 TaxID=3081292 RepID=UPI00301B2463
MIDRWWQMDAIPRYGLLTAFSSGLLLLSWILWLRPQQQTLTAEQQALFELTRTLQQRQQEWRQNPDNTQLQAQLQSMQSARPASGASGRAVEEILAARRSQLEEWQPDASSRTLTLHLQWQAFQSLFAELADAAAPFPVHFQLLAQPQFLVAQLWLEPEDAP